MISVLQLGTIDYATGLRLQQRLVDLRKEGRIGDVLLLLEHTPVITLGRNAKQKNIVASPRTADRSAAWKFSSVIAAATSRSTARASWSDIRFSTCVPSPLPTESARLWAPSITCAAWKKS